MKLLTNKGTSINLGKGNGTKDVIWFELESRYNINIIHLDKNKINKLIKKLTELKEKLK